nr:serine/threonine protein kinase [Gemmatimonadaceae bacterium]
PLDADALEALLATDVSAVLTTGAFVGTLAALTGHPSLAGQALGAWTLVRPLGRGGMGAVWLAERNDGRFAGRAAVKLLHPSLTEGANAQRFQREGEVLARLTHPNIARLYDAGVTPHGQPYLVLEYIEGERIDEWARARQASDAMVVALLEQVLSAVAHAHAHGVIHRDIKPSNLLVTADGSVKLLDFGIAHLADDGVLESGRAPFTPRYAAPEQLRGEAVTTATDVHAVGLVTDELLATAGSRSRDLTAIAARARASAPAARYPSATAMLDDLRRAQRHEPVDARGGGVWYRWGRFAQRHAVAVSALGIVLLTAFGAAIFSATQARRARAERDAARLAEQRARVTGEIMLGVLGQSRGGDSTVRLEATLRRVIGMVESTTGRDPVAQARLLLGVAGMFRLVDANEEADSVQSRALALATRGNDEALIAEAECARASTRILRSHGTSSALVDAGARRLAALRDPPWTARATCLISAASALLNVVRLDSAVALARAARALALGAGDSTSSLYLASLAAEANALGFSPRRREGLAARQAYVRALERVGLDGTLVMFDALAFVAQAHVELGELRLADSVAGGLLRDSAYVRLLADAPPNSMMQFAELEGLFGRRASAILWFRRARERAERLGAPVQAQRALRGEIEQLAASGRAGEARRLLAQHGDADAARGELRVLLESAVLRGEGRSEAAFSVVDSLLRSRGYPARPRMANWQRALRRLIITGVEVGRWEDALAASRRLDQWEPRDAEARLRSSNFGLDLMYRSAALWGMGDRSAARATIDSAMGPMAADLAPAHPFRRRADSVYRRIFGRPWVETAAAGPSR